VRLQGSLDEEAQQFRGFRPSPSFFSFFTVRGSSFPFPETHTGFLFFFFFPEEQFLAASGR